MMTAFDPQFRWLPPPSDDADSLAAMLPAIFSGGMGPYNPEPRQVAATMRMDVLESPSDYEIFVEAPGLSKADLTIELDPAACTCKVMGNWKPSIPPSKENTWHVKERRVGHFERSFKLATDCDCEKCDATMKNGLLTIKIPKNVSPERAPRKVLIK